MLNKMLWQYRIICLSLRWIRTLNLGDLVIFRGEEWAINQGVARPYFDLVCVSDGKCVSHVHMLRFKKVRSLRNWWGSFCSGYQFYRRSWYDIWVRVGVEPCELGLNIWAGKAPSWATGITQEGE